MGPGKGFSQEGEQLSKVILLMGSEIRLINHLPGMDLDKAFVSNGINYQAQLVAEFLNHQQ